MTASKRLRRIGLVSPAWSPGKGANGIVTYVTNLRAGLAAVDVASIVIANQVDPPPSPADHDVIDAGRFLPPRHLRALWKAHERIAGGVLYEQRLAFGVTRALQLAHRRAPLDLFEMEESFGTAELTAGAIPRPMIVRLHGPWCLVSPALGLPRDAAFHRKVEREGRAISLANAVSSPSRFALQNVRAYYGLDLPDAVVVPNPIALAPVDRRWRFDDCDRRTILFVGRFDRLKGGDVVLRAFGRVAAELPQAQLVFVGPDRGLRDDAGKTWSFDEYARAHLPREVVARISMRGEQPSVVIAELRRKSFVTVVASRFETFSMTAVEALAHGSPLIAPAAGAIVEIVEPGRNGLLFADADADDLARQILTLFRDPELAQKLAAGGIADVASRFEPATVARTMRAFYQDVFVRTSGRLGTWRRARRSLQVLWPH